MTTDDHILKFLLTQNNLFVEAYDISSAVFARIVQGWFCGTDGQFGQKVALLKIGNGSVISSHTSLGMCLLIHAGIKVKPCG